ncbi:MAG: hypothetical protein HY978_03480 [Candidatus Liptonbacteria bacterium]|nr:hypothetical protein [Candidatus Liptonbacteria bacterium]
MLVLMSDPETQTCEHCHGSFEVSAEDASYYAKIQVPPPTICPLCRQQRRMLFRNFKTLYKRPSDRSLKPVISMYSPQAPYKVYTHEEWWADDWDAKIFGRSFDFGRPFFEQFRELLLAVPRFAIMNVNSTNCEYSNFAWGDKNCYLVFGAVNDEDCAYGHIVWESKDSLDNLYLHKSELCYECVDCLGSYGLKYCQECESCNDCLGCFDCRGCTNCVGCVGLKDKTHYLFNQPVDQATYKQFLADHPLTDPATIPMIQERQEELRRQIPQRHFFGSHNNDASGNHVYNARNLHDSFDVKGGENSRFIYTSRQAVDSYDVAFSPNIEQVYCSLTTLNCNRVFFAHLATTCSDLYYSDSCFNTHNCFGCAGLKGGEYCILNKQYTKEEYEALLPRVIAHLRQTGEWGQFFPTELSPFCYNESIANEYLPLTKEQALAQGFRWQDELPSTVGQETMTLEALPKGPKDYSDELAKQILKCDHCSRNYRLVPQELQFYKRLNLPIPHQCFNCRHARRMSARNSRRLWPGTCAKCGVDFRTSYPPEQQKEFKIYCEQCYQTEVA